eukprot:319187-Rhodomonas_salina.1
MDCVRSDLSSAVRGFARDATSAASDVGMDVVVAADYDLGDLSGMDRAVRRLADAGSRITLVVAYDEVGTIAALADQYGMMKSGYAWVVPEENVTPELVTQSADPESMLRQLTGWFTVAIDPMHGEQGPRFLQVLEDTPLQHYNQSRMEELIAASGVALDQCNQFCALAYDAVWTTAIALARVGLAGDGS